MATAASKTGMEEPKINSNPQLQSYYQSLESRVGYRLMLGGTRHFGYWDHDTYWPFPLSKGLRNMEDRMAEALALPAGSRVLDAGCGVGHVALRMAKAHGLHVKAIDVTEHHVVKAQHNIKRSGLSDDVVSAQRMDYHHLETFADASFDGIYTMETFVHATDPQAVLAGFRRLLKPGGRLVQFEYEHDLVQEANQKGLADSMVKINQYSAMPTNAVSHAGVFKKMLEEAGFEDVAVRDYSQNIRPMTRAFFLVAIVPYFFVWLFGLERRFINTVAGVESYRGRHHWRYVAISATKPGEPQVPFSG
ncbi:demethylrebeccamycin-D-glucose O-methyltransferase [Apiospora kogelbergensis]|uniref:Demethylrebeccamycin-D-glucose O-methyltransferase n=1 Tax=Apiospora kogelbergensis TaxID=1337665 RepID=A0AAW0QTT3_9PEZI